MQLPPKVKDLAGQEFGYWTVIRMDKLVKGQGAYWECECRCGHRASVKANDLRSGNTKSCGCGKSHFVAEGNRTHGQASGDQTGAYRSYRSMVNRCCIPSCSGYERYGALGITVCDRWRNSFQAFYEDMGDRPEGYSLERKDWRFGYYKENCCWIPLEDQSRNTSANVWFMFNGVKMIAADVAKLTGIPRQRLSAWSKNPHRIPKEMDLKVVIRC